jgi:hypothetical protein
MHVVAEHGALVRVRIEVVVAGLAAELGPDRAQDVVTRGLERVLAGPHLADDLEPRIAAAGVDAEQSPAGAQGPGQRSDDAGGLEFHRHPRAIGLGGDDEVVVGPHAALAGDDVVEQEAKIVAVDDERHGALVDGVACFRRMLGLPDLGEQRLQGLDLLAELRGRAARERHLVPDERGGGGERLRRQPGGLRVVHVGDHQHGRRVLVEAVGHLVEAQPRILEADLLAHHVERQRRKAAVHLAHDAGQDRAVAHAGIEHAHRRRLGMQMGEFHADAAGDDLFLRARIDEQQVFLPVVEEAEIARRRPLRAGGFDVEARQPRDPQQRHQFTRGGGGLHPLAVQEFADPLQRLRGDAGTVAQPRDEFAIVHRMSAEGGFGHPCPPAKLRDAVQQTGPGIGGRHGLALLGCGSKPRNFRGILASAPLGEQPQSRGVVSWDVSHIHILSRLRRPIATARLLAAMPRVARADQQAPRAQACRAPTHRS